MRTLRLLGEGHCFYHCISRVVDRRFIFGDEEKEFFRETMRNLEGFTGVQVVTYAIMDNHIHFILNPLKGDSLSAIMQWILGVFAQKYNRTFDLHGHVWYDRFKSKIIIDFRQYLHTCVYISNNPVKAGMVGTPVDYPYGGIYYLQKGIPGIMERPPNRVLRIIWRLLCSP